MLENVHVGGYGPNKVTIEGLTADEKDAVFASLDAGCRWIRNVGGRLVVVSAFDPFPNPIKDEKMFPFWREPNDEEKRLAACQPTLLALDELHNHSSPSIHIQSLCGYNYSAENYKAQAEKLESYGFCIMRSPRGEDGHYWETWYLPGLWAAKGDLKEKICEAVDVKTEKEKLSVALEFLRHHVQFGTLDVCVQRLAMVMSD